MKDDAGTGIAALDDLEIWTAAIERKKAGGRGKNGRISLYGIRKLRELILELAVRGKLVPQDPNDEPASVLLEKVAEEKAQLVKEGKIKKQKKLPEISQDEIPFGIPSNWVWQRLADVFYPISVSKNKIKMSEVNEAGKLPVVDQGQSFVAGYTDRADLEIKIPGPVVVFGDHTTTLKYVDFDFVAGADGVKILRPVLIYEQYFYVVAQTLPIENRGYGRHYSRLVDNLFPVPPLAEQNRIVAKVDELMALCDQLERQQSDSLQLHQTLVETLLAGLVRATATDGGSEENAIEIVFQNFDTLFTTEESIDQLKQTILQLAVMGKLVPQDPGDEPASVLLEKIAKEKKRLVKEGKVKKKKAFSQINDYKKSFESPAGWVWAHFSDIALQITDGAHHTPRYVESGIPFLSVKDMSSGVLDFSKTRFITEEQHVELSKRCHPEKGDLLLTKVGTTGIPILVETEREFSIFVSVALIKFSQNLLFGKYLSLLVSSPFVKNQSEEGTEGIGNKNLVLRKINTFMLAIPPLAEQHRIVAKVDELMAMCDALKGRLREAESLQARLADAVADQAVA